MNSEEKTRIEDALIGDARSHRRRVYGRLEKEVLADLIAQGILMRDDHGALQVVAEDQPLAPIESETDIHPASQPGMIGRLFGVDRS